MMAAWAAGLFCTSFCERTLATIASGDHNDAGTSLVRCSAVDDDAGSHGMATAACFSIFLIDRLKNRRCCRLMTAGSNGAEVDGAAAELD
jgi:hypothetical protein